MNIKAFFSWVANVVRAHWNFIADHWYFALLIVLAFVGYNHLDSHQEFAYGALRFLLFWLFGFLLLNLAFKETVAKYIYSKLADDFASLPVVHKIWITFTTIFFVVWTAITSSVHP